MDLNLGDGRRGREVTARLRALTEPPNVLVLTTYDTEADILRALDAGALGYLLKDAPPDELFAGIRATARGETVLAPSVAARLVRRTVARRRSSPNGRSRCSSCSRGGWATGDGTRALVSEATVKSHLSHVYTKLGVDTRAGASRRRSSAASSGPADDAALEVTAVTSDRSGQRRIEAPFLGLLVDAFAEAVLCRDILGLDRLAAGSVWTISPTPSPGASPGP